MSDLKTYSADRTVPLETFEEGTTLMRKMFETKHSLSAGRVDKLINTIATLESGDKNIYQGTSREGQPPVKGKPASGYYQIEGGSRGGSDTFKDALNSYSNIMKSVASKTGTKFVQPEWVKKAKDHDDASLLTKAQQQDILLAKLYVSAGSDARLLEYRRARDDDTALRDIWMEDWWKGHKSSKRTEEKNKEIKSQKIDWYNKKMGTDTGGGTKDSAFNEMKNLDDPFGGRLG